MTVQSPAHPPDLSPPEIEAGVIEDARARQRRHRRVGGVLVAAVAAGVLIAAVGGGGPGSGGGAGTQPSGAGGGGAAHASVSNPFPGAPSTQPNGNGVEDDFCPMAQPNRYLPARSGCVSVRRADMNGDGRPDLIIAYSTLDRERPSGYEGGAIPPPVRGDYGARAAFLKVVLADGATVTTRVSGTKLTKATAIDAIAHVNDEPGSEIFLEVEGISSGEVAVAYGYHDGRLVPAGAILGYGGDSATQNGFDCLAGDPPRIIEWNFQLIGPTVHGWWKETVGTLTWRGPKLVSTSSHSFKRRGQPPRDRIEIGRGCVRGIG